MDYIEFSRDSLVWGVVVLNVGFVTPQWHDIFDWIHCSLNRVLAKQSASAQRMRFCYLWLDLVVGLVNSPDYFSALWICRCAYAESSRRILGMSLWIVYFVWRYFCGILSPLSNMIICELVSNWYGTYQIIKSKFVCHQPHRLKSVLRFINLIS